MNEQDAVDRLKHLGGDPESDHGVAEEILCEFLRSCGHMDVADAFEEARDRIGFWYA